MLCSGKSQAMPLVLRAIAKLEGPVMTTSQVGHRSLPANSYILRAQREVQKSTESGTLKRIVEIQKSTLLLLFHKGTVIQSLRTGQRLILFPSNTERS